VVALKLIRQEWRRDSSMVARFKEELRLARRIAHPNVCRIHDIFEERSDGREFLFFTMRYLDGDTLAEVLAQPHPLDRETVLLLAEGIAAGLDAAHREGIIHRDLKPSNILLPEGRPVITDFGLARLSDPATGNVTQTGLIGGSPDYMSPEQFLDRPRPAASDIFSFGIIVYEMIAGRRPYPQESLFRLAVRRATEDPEPLRHVRRDMPRSWERTLAWALHR